MYDPDFPNRPSHRDFARMSEVVLGIDGEITEDQKTPEEVIEKIVDPDSLFYMAEQRAMRLQGISFSSLTALYIDAFMTGATFGQRYLKEEKV